MESRLTFHNPWWQTGQVPAALIYDFYRDIYPVVKSYMDLGRVILLKGPRRTGKSTIFYQLVNELITRQHVNPVDILYLSFDDPVLRTDLYGILKYYEKMSGRLLNEPPVKYLFLDEVQFLPDWAVQVKLFYDKKLPLRILGSGSSASLIIKQSESLGGRTIEETVLPLNFSEWKRYHGEKSSVFGQGEEVLFRNYLGKSVFMHLLDIADKELWMKMLSEDLVTKAIYKDAVQIFGLREPAVLEKMFSFLAASTSGIINGQKLSGMLGIIRPQVTNYLTFLRNSMLVFTLGKYAPRVRETLRSQEKVHVIDQGFGPVYSASPSGVLESVVARHLWEKHKNNLYFWREKYEVDLVVAGKRSLLPIEVKNSAEVALKELHGLMEFGRKFKQETGLVAYFGSRRTEQAEHMKIKFIPVWELLKGDETNL